MVSGLNAIDKMVIFIGVFGVFEGWYFVIGGCLEIALQNFHPLLSLGDQGFIS